MQREFRYDGSYDTVKRYIKNLKSEPKKVYMVLNTLPGEEAQIESGYIGSLKSNNRLKKAWIFITTLSYPRYMYVQIVFDQTVKIFIGCHENAFKYFGGIPKTVKIDNLKSGILQADFFYVRIINR
jgi:transposase